MLYGNLPDAVKSTVEGAVTESITVPTYQRRPWKKVGVSSYTPSGKWGFLIMEFERVIDEYEATNDLNAFKIMIYISDF